MMLKLFNEITQESLAIAEMIYESFSEPLEDSDGFTLTDGMFLWTTFRLDEITFEPDDTHFTNGFDEVTHDFTNVRIIIRDEENYGEMQNNGIVEIVIINPNNRYQRKEIRKVETANPKMLELVKQQFLELGMIEAIEE